MVHRVLRVTAFVCAAISLFATAALPLTSYAFAQSSDAKPAEQAQPQGGQEPAKDNHKIDEFAEAQKVLGSPAGNPECVWLGRRVVSLLWRDDLDTAFRHLDLYDRFGCPSGHIQASFRCLLLHANSIDPKAADSLINKVQACWLNPTMQASSASPAPAPTPAAPAAPAAAAPNPPTTR